MDYGTEEFLKQVELVWGEVVEVAASCDVALYSPWEVGLVVVEIAGWYGEAYLDVEDFAYDLTFYELFDFLKIGEGAAVICYETGHSGLMTDAYDALAVYV